MGQARNMGRLRCPFRAGCTVAATESRTGNLTLLPLNVLAAPNLVPIS